MSEVVGRSELTICELFGGASSGKWLRSIYRQLQRGVRAQRCVGSAFTDARQMLLAWPDVL
jgi:hypothetical protein